MLDKCRLKQNKKLDKYKTKPKQGAGQVQN